MKSFVEQVNAPVAHARGSVTEPSRDREGVGAFPL
jgi:hypothetical protein